MAPRESEPQKETVERVMHEFKHGELRSGPSGQKVKNRRQAVAIALSEAGASNQQTPKENKEHLRRTKAKERRGETAQAETEGKAPGRRRSTARSKTRLSTGRKKSDRRGCGADARMLGVKAPRADRSRRQTGPPGGISCGCGGVITSGPGGTTTSGPGWGSPGPSSGCGSSTGVGGRTTSGSGRGAGWSG